MVHNCLPSDIIYIIFDITEYDCLSYAISCKDIYTLWKNKNYWKQNIKKYTKKVELISMIDTSDNPYITYNKIKSGLDLHIYTYNYSNSEILMKLYWAGKLTSLKLDNLCYTEIPPFIGNITTLTELSLISNKITYIPKSFKKLKLLETLILSKNQFQVMSSTFKYLVNLKKLDMNYNQLSTIPSFIYNLNNLISLDFGYNKIRYIQ
jgi:Leucine-rich repeat (LRR) protein